MHERAASKTVNSGDIDHVCGGLLAGETPELAVVREAKEEVGVTPTNLRVVRRGITPYNRYCYLYVGESNEEPGTELDPKEVAWARYYYPNELIEANESGKLSFVDGFFEGMALAVQK